MISSPRSSLTACRRIVLGAALGLLVLAAPLSGLMVEASTPAGAGEVRFMRDVAPILAQRCFPCHDAKAKEPGGDLRLDIFESLMKGKHPAVVAGEPEQSEMINRITEEDTSSRMPREDDPLTPAQIDLIRRWIQAGAKFDGPDPKTPYATRPDAPGAPTAAPQPLQPPKTTAEGRADGVRS